MHHEPAATQSLVIVGFGNSEESGISRGLNGSEPSGVAAYDRISGIERWRHNTRGSVMTSPVLFDSVVAVVTGGGEAIAWRTSDGAEVWRTELPGTAQMANPLLRDTVMFVGLERTTVCSLNVRTGARNYCVDLSRKFETQAAGAGHASPTSAGKLVLVTYDRGPSLRDRLARPGATNVLRHFFGVPEVQRNNATVPPPTFVGEQVLVAIEADNGNERWRAPLGVGSQNGLGHLAGTPVFVDGVAYVTSPINGRIIAVRTDSGSMIWSSMVNSARGTVLVTSGEVIAATRDTGFVVLDAVSGRVAGSVCLE